MTQNSGSAFVSVFRRRNWLGVILAVFVGFLVLVCAANLLIIPLRQERALVKPSLTPEQAEMALKSLTPEELQRLKQRERQRLQHEPLDTSALSNLALIETLGGNTEAAGVYSKLAADRNLRDPVSQMIAIESYFSLGDSKQAFSHVDALLSSNPQLALKIFPALLPMLDDATNLTLLTNTLARRPAWRYTFVSWLVENDHTGTRTFALLDSIRAGGGTVDDEERRRFLTKLVDQKDYDRAYYFWLDSLSSAELLKVNTLYDGEFAFTPKNLFFDWNILPLANVATNIVARANGNNAPELRLNFTNNEHQFWHVYQILRLQPGNYVMQGGWTSARLTTPAGLVWSVVCVSSEVAVGKSTAFANASAEADFSFLLNVPATGCDFQVLRLTNASPALLDAKIDGDLEFFNLKIETK